MPGFLDETRRILRFLVEELGPETYVNIMAQYYPAGKVKPDKYPEINRHVTTPEYEAAVQMAHDFGLRLDVRKRVN
jgi:putative pyruvate formate lyase activating enzyme